MRASHRPTRLIYIDDSGAESTGFATFSWASVTVDDWSEALSELLSWRTSLLDRFGIPKRYELHAVKFANGRGNPSLNTDWNRRKAFRSLVLDDAFTTFAAWDWLTVGTIFSRCTFRRDEFARERERVYGCLIEHLDHQLQRSNEWGIIIMDGDGSDDSYRSAHRRLPLSRRSLVEDPGFQHSSQSQWIQLADLIAYSAYQSLAEIPTKDFAWGWYPRLSSRAGDVIDVSPEKEAGPVDRRTSGGSASS